MSIVEVSQIDHASVDHASGDLWLTISDHLPWNENEGDHLVLLQEKLNVYLRFVESGEVFEKIPEAVGKKIVINLVGKFPMSVEGKKLFQLAGSAIRHAGLDLQFQLMQPH